MRRLFLIFALLFAPSWCGAQSVVPGTVDTIQCTSATGTSYSKNFNIPASGGNLLAVIPVSWGNNANGNNNITITAISLGGTSILANTPGPAINSNTSGYYGWIQDFYLANPPTGASETLSITFSATNYRSCANAVTFLNVNQTTPIMPGSYQTAINNTGIYGGLISTLGPSQNRNIIFSSQTNSTDSLSSGQTSAGNSSSNATGYGYWQNAYSTNSSPQLRFTWGGGSHTDYICMLAFSIQSIANSSVEASVGGVSIGTLPGQISNRGGASIGSAVSGKLGSIGGLSEPSGTLLVNSFINFSGGTNGAAPTTTTLGNSVKGDYDYYTWSIASMGGGITYSNGLSIGNLLQPVESNDGTVNTATGTLGILCTTGTSVHCGQISSSVGGWGQSASMGYWFESTCTGATQDCGAGAGIESIDGNVAGLSVHVNGTGPPCNYSGFSIDDAAESPSGCISAYAPGTLYRVNLQMNDGESPFTATFSTTTPIITGTNTLAANQAVQISNSGGSLPAGISANTTYYVLPIGLSGSQFTLGTVQSSQGGTPIQVTSAGSGTQTVTVYDQATICNAAGTFLGNLVNKAVTTPHVPGQVSFGIGGEEPSVAGFLYYWYGAVLDGTGKFSGTGCVL